MRKNIVLLFCLIILGVGLLNAQKHEVGVFYGFTNVIGDIGSTEYIRPYPVKEGLISYPISFGGFYRHNFNPRQGVKISGTYAEFSLNDQHSNEQYRVTRGAQTKNKIFEFAAVFEYSFFDINDNIQESASSPYIFAGLGIFSYSKTKYYTTPTTAYPYSKTAYNISVPFGLGYKIKFNNNFVASAEIGFRPTSIDDLDHSNVSRKDFGKEYPATFLDNKNIGDSSNKDWYVFTGVSLAYAFGRPPCYCK